MQTSAYHRICDNIQYDKVDDFPEEATNSKKTKKATNEKFFSSSNEVMSDEGITTYDDSST